MAGARGAPTAVVVRLGREVVALAPPFARVVAATGEGAWRVRARSARHVVEIEGEGTGAPALLPVPLPSERRAEDRSRQHLVGRMRVLVRRGRRVLLRGESALAGLERGVPLGELSGR